MLDLPHSREYFAALFDTVGSWPNGLGYSILNIWLKSRHTVDSAEFVVKRFKESVKLTRLSIAQARTMKPRQMVNRLLRFVRVYQEAGD